MRKLQFEPDRQSIETIYLTFHRSVLEYANVVWDNCTYYEKEELEKNTEWGCKNCYRHYQTPVVFFSTDRSKAVVLVLFLLFVALFLSLPLYVLWC